MTRSFACVALLAAAVFAGCNAAPAGPRPMPLALDEAPFVFQDPRAREELTLRPNRSFVLRRMAVGQPPAVTTGFYEPLRPQEQVVLLNNQTAIRLRFIPEAPLPLTFERVPLVSLSQIHPNHLGEYVPATGQWHIPVAALAPRQGEVSVNHLLPGVPNPPR